MTLQNIILKIRFNLFKSKVKRVDFTTRKLLFSDECIDLNNFNVKDGEFYNDNDVWFSKDMVTLTPDGIKISCKQDQKSHTSYQGTRTTKWTSGMISTYNKIQYSKGIWVVTAKICDSWPAIWLLKYDRIVSGYTRTQITPEIDILEIIKHKIQHGIAYGYSNTIYRTKGVFSRIIENDNSFHEFAVEILNNGYNFYVDGIKTAVFASTDPEFVTDDPNYLILNNAVQNSSDVETIDTEFIIKSIKFYL